MENIDSIRNRILKIRECLDKINGEDISINYNLVADFEDKLNYPIDFQIFMDEIGEFSSSSEVGEGYRILKIAVPKPLIGNDLMALNDFKEGDEVIGITKAEDVRMFGSCISAQCYGFDTIISPYKFISWNLTWDVGENFLEWFVNFVNNELDENPYFEKDIRLE
jgi:hypothetical protein